jgi:hypothetical protein
MSFSGKNAKDYLKTIDGRVALHKKDKKDKMWSYKIKTGKRTEFAFDPNTTRGVYLRVDREIPALCGVTKIENLKGVSVSTALDRVFTGGLHKARYKATIEDENALSALISHYEAL